MSKKASLPGDRRYFFVSAADGAKIQPKARRSILQKGAF